MKALILAGGMGTRLYPLTWQLPKSMVPFANRPFLERFLGWLQGHGVEEAILALSHMPEAIREYFKEGEAYGLRLRYIVEETPLGSGGAIRNAQELLGGGSFLVLNGDIFTDLDLREIVDFHRARKAAMTISLARVEDPSHYGVVDLEENGRLRRFVEKPAPGEAPSNLINAGVWVFEPEMLERMPPAGEAFSVERAFWPKCLKEGVPMYGFKREAYWLDIGTIARYLQAHRDILAGRIEVKIGEAKAAPGIWLGAGAEVDPQAEVRPPVIIGAGARIGAGAQISESVIGPQCRIGAGARVSGSVLWREVTVGGGARVQDAAIGCQQEIAAESVFASAALEERGACAPGDD